MRKRLTALTTIILILISNAGSLFARDHSDCKMMKEQITDHCEMMEMKMDCCPSEQPASQECACPEMNGNDQEKHDTSQVILIKSLETPGKIILDFSILNQFEDQPSNSPYLNSFNPLKPDNKIYKAIHSFLI